MDCGFRIADYGLKYLDIINPKLETLNSKQTQNEQTQNIT
jgi:hypothetical protein